MTIVRVKHDKQNPYVMINRKALWDGNLSLEAIGLWARLLSRPDNWHINVKELSTSSGVHKNTIYKILQELEDNGYCLKEQVQGSDGKFGIVEYHVYETSITVKVKESFTQTENPEAVDFADKKQNPMCKLKYRYRFTKKPVPVKCPILSTDSKHISNPPSGSVTDKEEENEEEEEDFRTTKEEEEYVMQKLRERDKSLPKITSWSAWKAAVIKNYREEKERDREVESNEEKHKAQALAYDGKRINGDLVSVCRDRVEFTSGSFFKAVPFALSPESWAEQTRRWFQDSL